MSRRLLPIAFLGLLIALFAAGCGDGPGTSAAATKAPKATKTTDISSGGQQSPAASWPGPAPRFGTNVTAITPQHGTKVTQADTRSPNPTKPRGVCFVASFKDLGDDAARWFRMAVDDKEVTTQDFTWIVSDNDQPEGGRGCYAPVDGLKVGKHTAAVSVQNPNNPSEPTRELVSWAFEVVQ